jgi:hypothetical protein
MLSDTISVPAGTYLSEIYKMLSDTISVPAEPVPSKNCKEISINELFLELFHSVLVFRKELESV